MSEQCVGYRPTPTHQQHQPPQHQFSSVPLAVPAWHSCFHQLPTCLYHIYVSQLQRLEEFGIDWTTPPHPTPTPFQYITTLPQRPHSTFLLSKGYPSAPEPNSSHVLRERSAELGFASPEKAPASPKGPKNATNYWESDAEGLLLTPDRYCWGSELTPPDTLGDGGRHCLEPALLHHVSLWCDTRPLPLSHGGNIL